MLDQGLPEQSHAICDQLYDPDNAEKLTALGTIYGQHGVCFAKTLRARYKDCFLLNVTLQFGAVCRPTLLAIAAQPRKHWGFSSH